MVARPATCSAPNCRKNRRKIPNLSLFQVPINPVRSKEWITNCGRKDLLLKDSTYLHRNIRFCSFHFVDSQFMNSLRNRLVWDAVPTIFNNETDVKQTEPRKSIECQSFNNNPEFEKVQTQVCNTKKQTVKADLQGKPHTSVPECKTSVKYNAKIMKNLNPLNKIEIKLGTPESNSSSLTDELNLSLYKKKVEAFTRKLGLPLNKTFKPLNTQDKTEDLEKNECHLPVKINETKDNTNATDKELDVQIKSGRPKNKTRYQSCVKPVESKRITNPAVSIDLQKKSGQEIECYSLAKDIETKATTHPTDEVTTLMKLHSSTNTRNVSITNAESSKYQEKVEAFEKIIVALKAEHKAETKRLKTLIKELRRRNNRKDFMMSKLRREKNDLKNCTFYTKSQSKPNFRRDKHFIEQTLSKYVSKDTLHIVMSQMKNHSLSCYGHRWDDETKMFALNIYQTSPKAYTILRSYLQLPNVRTLQKFIQEADSMAASGLNRTSHSDVEGDNEEELLLEEGAVFEIHDSVISDPEIISSIVEVEYDNYEDMTEDQVVSSVVEIESDAQLTFSDFEKGSEDTNINESPSSCGPSKDTGDTSENVIVSLLEWQ